MTPQDFDFLARVLKLRSGLAVVPNKRFQLETRLGPVVHGNGFTDVSELVCALRRASDDALLAQVTAALAADDAFFFRDATPFEHLAAHMVPEALRRGAAARGLLRVWSAGCGAGQEPYSIAMQLLEARGALGDCGLEIVATDRSEPALKTAAQGRYTQFEVQRGLPIELLLKYFHKAGWHWQIDDAVRAMVSFRHGDLLGPDDGLGAFDIIFCRNVLLCLDAAARGRALERLAAHLRPGGFLVLGLTETAAGARSAFAPVPGQRGVFICADEAAPVPPRRLVPLHAAPA